MNSIICFKMYQYYIVYTIKRFCLDEVIMQNERLLKVQQPHKIKKYLLYAYSSSKWQNGCFRQYFNYKISSFSLLISCSFYADKIVDIKRLSAQTSAILSAVGLAKTCLQKSSLRTQTRIHAHTIRISDLSARSRSTPISNAYRLSAC